KEAPATLALFDVSGRLLAKRPVGALGAGHHVVDLQSGRALPPGIYLVQLVQGSEKQITRFTVLRQTPGARLQGRSRAARDAERVAARSAHRPIRGGAVAARRPLCSMLVS